MLCALALVLVMDISGSIGDRAYDAMREGHAAAFESEEVRERISPAASLVVAVVQFDAAADVVLGWHQVGTAPDAVELAGRLRRLPRLRTHGGTITAAGIDLARQLLRTAPCVADREVIDVVSDGLDDPGRTAAARDRAEGDAVRINALMVGAGLEEWARSNLVTPDGFVLVAQDWEAFILAMRRKLAHEAAGTEPGANFAGTETQHVLR